MNTSIVNIGNTYRFGKAFEKALRKEKMVIGYLGGSITMGCHATMEDRRYVNQSFAWWKMAFPNTKFELVNAGIGATTSQFGVARADDDLLSHNPDVVILEFSVNDDCNEHFMETYEGLVRKILKSPSKPALMIVNNLFYDSGVNSQEIHNKIGKGYSLPIVSVRDYVYPKLQRGELDKALLTSDNLHPLDEGHTIIASLIKNCLDNIVSGIINFTDISMPNPLTLNRYENSVRLNNRNFEPALNGFSADKSLQNGITDVFKNGWTARKNGAALNCELDCTTISVQWQRTINRPAPVAIAIVDGDEENAITLDANFEETWGDLICLTTLFEGDKKAHHTLEIRLVNAEENSVPLNIVSIIVSE